LPISFHFIAADFLFDAAASAISFQLPSRVARRFSFAILRSRLMPLLILRFRAIFAALRERHCRYFALRPC